MCDISPSAHPTHPSLGVSTPHSCQNAPIDFACDAAQVYCNAAIESKYVESGAWARARGTAPSMVDCVAYSHPTTKYSTGLNVYDIRIPCEVPGLCYDFSNVEVS